jgi:predicted DsbA family dithiol-disulfide isomerase
MPAEPAANPVGAVDFHFDIMCPWAYQASLWIRDVRDQVGLDVRWRFFSLEEVNRAEGKKHPWERDWSYGWSMMRIGALLRRADPDPALVGQAIDDPSTAEEEVQRPKTQQDLAAVAETFPPYLEARDWVTMQKETP